MGMTEQEREWMERYIYQVTRRLPKAQRGETAMELRELIGDMAEEKGSVEAALTALGDPAVFAGQYRGDSRCLIGPEYYDQYVWLLKIVLSCVLFGVLVASVVSGVLEIQGAGFSVLVDTLVKIMVNAVGNTLISCLGAFGGLTLVFAVMERLNSKEALRQAACTDRQKFAAGDTMVWTPGKLPPIPEKKAVISRGDSAVGLVFILLLALLLLFWPQLFSVFFKDGDSIVSVPVFNLAQWDKILPVLLISLVAGFADEMLRLIRGVYCRAVMVSNILCSILQIVCTVVLFRGLTFWNVEFVAEIQAHAPEDFPLGDWLCAYWDAGLLSNMILLLLIAVTLLEAGVTVYKTLRYGLNRDKINEEK